VEAITYYPAQLDATGLPVAVLVKTSGSISRAGAFKIYPNCHPNAQGAHSIHNLRALYGKS
jgi:hypothetical protein